MIVVEDCVSDRHQAAHAINLFDMHQKYADVLPSAEVVGYIVGGADRRAIERLEVATGRRAND